MKLDAAFSSRSEGKAAKKATSKIPIVVALMADPVGTGLVASLARPGGNITGMSIQSTDLAGKQIQFLKEALPALQRYAILTTSLMPEPC